MPPRAKVIKEPVFKKQKTAQLYQQTFWGTGASFWNFRFSRIYKSKPENKLIIRVIQSVCGIAAENKNDKPYVLTLTNGADINGKCNLFYNNGSVDATTLNPFVLGITGSGGHPATATGSPAIIVNDMPLNQMTISAQHFDLSSTGNVNVLVVFEIEEIEEV
jgi:hypothetical protein